MKHYLHTENYKILFKNDLFKKIILVALAEIFGRLYIPREVIFLFDENTFLHRCFRLLGNVLSMIMEFATSYKIKKQKAQMVFLGFIFDRIMHWDWW